MGQAVQDPGMGQVPPWSMQHQAQWVPCPSIPPVSGGLARASKWEVLQHQDPEQAASPHPAVLQICLSQQPAFILGYDAPPPSCTPIPMLYQHCPAWSTSALRSQGGSWEQLAPPFLPWSLTTPGSVTSCHIL